MKDLPPEGESEAIKTNGTTPSAWVLYTVAKSGALFL